MCRFVPDERYVIINRKGKREGEEVALREMERRECREIRVAGREKVVGRRR